jgi:PPM family protein phosphatase
MHFGRRRARPSAWRPWREGAAETRSCADSFIECAYATNVGARPDNQDRCAISPRWVVLSDGAGGHAGGALAAELTIEAVVSCLVASPDALDGGLIEAAVAQANSAVRARRRSDRAVANMAATLVVAVAASVAEHESHWIVGSIGDSRAWLVTPERATQVTEDDNVAAELVRSGKLTPAEGLAHPGRHWITRAIGAEDDSAPRLTPVSLRACDALLVASDGLDVLTADEIEAVMTESEGATGAAAALIDLALRRDTLDNVTAAVVRHMPFSGDAPGTRG